MNLVITGGLGHIGSRLIRELPSRFSNCKIVVLDNLSRKRDDSLDASFKTAGGYQLVKDDIRTADLQSLFESADAVIHLAALTNAAESVERKEETFEVNLSGTERVAKACLDAKVPLFFPSTTSVYSVASGMVDESASGDDLNPQSPYAESKLAAEIILNQLKNQGLRYVIARFGNIVGPSPSIHFHTAVNKFCLQAAKSEPVSVWTTALKQKRPYLDLSDCIEAIVFILKKELFDGDLFNIVTENVTVEQILEMIQVDLPDLQTELVEHQIMNQLSYQVLTQKFEKKGFCFKGNLKKAIHETIQLLQ